MDFSVWLQTDMGKRALNYTPGNTESIEHSLYIAFNSGRVEGMREAGAIVAELQPAGE